MTNSPEKKKVVKASYGESLLTETQRAWWNEIKELTLELYGLPEQKVSAFASPMNMDEDSIYLTIKAPAALPALEEALAKHYSVDPDTKVRVPKFSIRMVDKYVIVKPSEGKIVKGTNGKFSFVPKSE